MSPVNEEQGDCPHRQEVAAAFNGFVGYWQTPHVETMDIGIKKGEIVDNVA
jgi:hypothetical protein